MDDIVLTKNRNLVDKTKCSLHLGSTMRTATVRELRNQYLSVLSWVEAGEEVVISRRGRAIARLVPEKPASSRVDWSQSAAAQLERGDLPVLSPQQTKALLADSQGHY
jgi:prevent-host-death family protein